MDSEPPSKPTGWWPNALDPATGTWASFTGILGEIMESRPITDPKEIASLMATLAS